MDFSKIKALFVKMLIATGGLFVFSFGVYLTIFAGIGLAPWDCLSSAISSKTSISFGIVHTSISVVILTIDILLKEKIGIGTVLDAFLVGPFIDFCAFLNPFKDFENNMLLSVILIISGMVLMAIGQAIYMKTALGCGPRDALTVGVGKRVPKIPIGLVQCTILGAVLLVGFILGGSVGIGTVLLTFGIGIIMQIVFNIIRFEPRSITHKSLIDSFNEYLK